MVVTAFVAVPEGIGIRTALASDDGEGTISGTYTLSLPMPGGTKESTLILVRHGNEITGTMTAPGDTSGASPIYNGSYNQGKFKLSSDIGRITYILEGSHLGQTLIFSMTTPKGMEMSASTDGKRDINVFYNGSYKGNRVELFTKTAQGSLFHFKGTVEGDSIKLTLNVTDNRTGLEAKRTN